MCSISFQIIFFLSHIILAMASTVTFIIMRGRRKNGNNIPFYVYRWKRKRWANKKESFIYITIIILIIRCVSVSMQKNGDFPISFESVADVTLSTYIILVLSLCIHMYRSSCEWNIAYIHWFQTPCMHHSLLLFFSAMHCSVIEAETMIINIAGIVCRIGCRRGH